MKTNKILTIAITLFLLAGYINSSAQVYFKLNLTPDDKTYIVSMISEVSLEDPMNMVSTSQISIKVPAGSNFVIGNLSTDLENVIWQESYVADSPKEAPEYEYISFGLTTLATRSIPFRMGEEVELFRFENLGVCPGDVSLIDNENDKFLFPNSKSVSISNGITVLGLGTQAYYGNYENGLVSCLLSDSKEAEVFGLESGMTLSPNPTADNLKVSYINAEFFENQKLMIYNLDGRLIHNENISGDTGNYQLEVDVRGWNSGSYIVYIENDRGTTKGNRFVKVGVF